MTKNNTLPQKEIKKLQERYHKLLDEIKLHDRLYYKENHPTISDFEYDCLKAELERLEQTLSEQTISIERSIIGDDRTNGFKTENHLSPMLSLANTYSFEELEKWDTRNHERLQNIPFSYVIEPKIDGVAINLIYRNGKFEKAITRGNGTIGDDVTNNIRTIINFPRNIKTSSQLLEIRGEIYIDNETFIAVNNMRDEQGKEVFSNPRNLAAGTLKTLDQNAVAARNLQLITYSIGYADDSSMPNQQNDILEWLKTSGFQSQEQYWTANNIQETWEAIRLLDEARLNFQYHTDGAVLKINQFGIYNILGTTAKSPKWAIAYKYHPERATTHLNNIIFQVGRTGIVTPVADFDTVILSGTRVSRATLHNADEMAKHDIHIGDYVIVEKAGEIIPAIVAVDKSKRQKHSIPFSFPTHCPACNSQLIQLPNEVAWRCQNTNCPSQIRRRISHFVSKHAMDIDGFGDSLIDKLVSSGILKNLQEIYRLTFNDIVSIEKFGTKSSLRLLENIDKSKNNPFWRLLHGIGISGVGIQTAKDIARHFTSFKSLQLATSYDLEKINGIGNTLSSAIIAFFNEKNNQQLISDLKEFGVLCKHTESIQTNAKISGKTFVLTGTLSTMTRQQAATLIENNGGIVSNTVSKATNVLIAGENCGSKLTKAQSIGTEIWDEKYFTNVINKTE